MNKMVKTTVSTLLAGGMLLAGCGTGANPSSSPENGSSSKENAEKTVTITMWNRIQHDLFDKAIAGFEEEHPNIDVQLENLPEAGQDVPQFQAAISSNELPDVFVRPTGYNLPQLAGLDLLHPLDSVFPKEEFEQYTAGTFAEGVSMIDGSVYQFPLFSSLHGSLVMYYNKKVLDSLGYTEADIPRAWGEFIEFGKEIHAKTDGQTYALTVGAKTNYMAVYLMNQLSTVISPETGMNYRTGRYAWNTQGLKETMEFFRSAYDEKVLHPVTLDADTGKAYSMLKSGEAAFMISGNWGGSYLTPADNDPNVEFKSEDWGVVPLPTKDGSDSFQYFEGGSGESIMVSKSTEHWPEVELFLQYLKEHIYEDIARTGSSLPSKKIDNLQEIGPFPQYSKIADLMEVSKVLTPSVYERNRNATDVMNNFNSYLPRENVGSIFLAYLTGQISNLDQALEDLTKGYNDALDKAISESNGQVTLDDFKFSDWVPGKPYTK